MKDTAYVVRIRRVERRRLAINPAQGVSRGWRNASVIRVCVDTGSVSGGGSQTTIIFKQSVELVWEGAAPVPIPQSVGNPAVLVAGVATTGMLTCD